jgi:hypothetical protein
MRPVSLITSRRGESRTLNRWLNKLHHGRRRSKTSWQRRPTFVGTSRWQQSAAVATPTPSPEFIN